MSYQTTIKASIGIIRLIRDQVDNVERLELNIHDVHKRRNVIILVNDINHRKIVYRRIKKDE